MQIIDKADLTPYNTFGIKSRCKSLVKVFSANDVLDLVLMKPKSYLVIGGGSNILFTQNFNGIVIKNEIKGIEIIDEDDKRVLVQVGAGEYWHEFVKWSVSHKLWGLENLSLIPGCVGAAPIQNIGAYGVEQNVCFHSLNAIELKSGNCKSFFNQDCQFGYRDSVFKREAKNKFIITHVTYMLSKIPKPILSYKELSLAFKDIPNPTIKMVSDKIVEVREAKLPDPHIIGNAGSFFKNPVIKTDKFIKLKAKFPNIVSYPSGNDIKLASGWLIEQCGFKGVKKGKTGTYQNQALIIVNYGSASGKSIVEFSQEIQAAVKKKFGVKLEAEVNFV